VLSIHVCITFAWSTIIKGMPKNYTFSYQHIGATVQAKIKWFWLKCFQIHENNDSNAVFMQMVKILCTLLNILIPRKVTSGSFSWCYFRYRPNSVKYEANLVILLTLWSGLFYVYTCWNNSHYMVNYGMLLPYLVKFVIFGIIPVLLVFWDKVTTQLRCMW